MIANTFIKRPITAIVISIVLVITGTVSILLLPIDQYPDITPPVVQVNGQFTGADAQTVEQTVAIPIEEQVNGTPGMEYMQSNSTNNGLMQMNVTFKIGTDIDVAALDVQNRVSIATPLLPAVVSRLGLTVRAVNPSMLMMVAIYSPKGTHNNTFLDNYTNIFVQDALLRVPGVGSINRFTDDFSMRIWMNPDKMASYSLTPADVIAALNAQNVQVAAGTAGVPPQSSSQTYELGILVNGRLSKVSEFENIIVKNTPSTGALVYMKDVARVELGKFTFSSNSFVDGHRASYLQIYQAPGSNALETANGIYSELAKLKQSFPSDVEYSVPFESVTVVKVSMQDVVGTLLKTLGLVAVVVFLFLQNWRSTLIPVLAIPVSIFGTFCFFIPLGFTINTLTMFGFVLAIGIVVDDAIIVVEAVQHYIDHDKMSPKEATYQAMKDISAPVIAIALILAAVFVPVGFIPGIVGRLYQQFAITIAISVMISAFIALSLTPALCTLLLKPTPTGKKANALNRFFNKFNTWFDRITASYTNGVQKSIKASRLIIILLVCICAGAYFMFQQKPSGFIPSEDDGNLYVTYQLPPASSTAQSVDVMQRLMKVISSTPGVAHYAALSGLNVVTNASNSNNGTIYCQLKPWDDRSKSSEQVPGLIGVMQKRISDAGIKNANIQVIQPSPLPGVGATVGFSMQIEQRNTNDNLQDFEKVVAKFVAAANKNPAISKAFSYYQAHTPNYNLTVDREKCEKLGVNISDVFTTIQAYMGSLYINDFTTYNRTFHVVVQADTLFRSKISDMDKYYVRNSAGTMVPLGTLISYKPTEAPPLVSHFNIFRTAEIDGSSAEGYSSTEALNALQELATKTLPEGYTYEFSGLSYEEKKAGSTTIYIFMFSITFVFLFLAALYESWSVPFSVLLAVPIGAFGAIMALLFVPTLTNNVYAQIGLITLIGLAAKNAILIVEFAKVRVDMGEELIKSTLEAVSLRLRPIIMTSLAFILGVLPLVLATGAGAVARQTIGYTVLGGMFAASTIAIFIVPVLFVVITRFSYGKHKLEYLQANREELIAKSKKVEAQNIDPELEYEIQKSRELSKEG
ncbi:efflux RND transporter permease subunit [Mucilaginibacter polytrichastri]|uniref:Efflux pump membrane transporter BepE n=1 Tax=Mucilaginibacter polytrichastri TaxID=1302689 RepID=A0A1Q6A020_9SPHI|nr:efflux RND transporter permease subunit [Mucilaginibacter polytrichastri]OKS87322.1 Efflux pump membrane transporter BepE [Mucilaginibacter polytrichastri]SFT21832.1 hydrophobic/amphiphilic exporter-1, HAE1 family [Mucilaginibacter polytrichastri]